MGGYRRDHSGLVRAGPGLMARFLAFNAIFFLLPFAGYAAWLVATRGSTGTAVIKSQASAIDSGKILAAKNNLHVVPLYSRRRHNFV